MRVPDPTVERHPWNTEFTWGDRTGPFRRITPEQAEQFDRDGFIVLDGVFTDDELAPVIAATDQVEARTDAFLSGQEGGRMSIAERGAITFGLFCVLSGIPDSSQTITGTVGTIDGSCRAPPC